MTTVSVSRRSASMRSFWNQKARENAYWFVSSYGDYSTARNLDEFWASGKTIWSDLKNVIGYQPTGSDLVVEIGCGVGRLTRAISPEVGSVLAIDISDEMLNIARQAELPNVTLQSGDGFTLPPSASGARLVLAYCVFQHLPSQEALATYLQHMARVAKPGGTIAFTLVSRDWSSFLMPLMRARAFVREQLRLNANGPKGVYRKEWAGIRPSAGAVMRMSPIPLMCKEIPGERLVFWGRKSIE
jgi:ubiquinone/menaquinone biosynthesis C-methylase UbiE